MPLLRDSLRNRSSQHRSLDVDTSLPYTEDARLSKSAEGNLPMKKQLTARQRDILDYIIQHIERHGYPPTIREIGAQFGIKSLRGVTVHLDALERKGCIRRERTSRSIQVLRIPENNKAETLVNLPLVGTTAAGTPRLAFEHIEAEIAIPVSIAGNGDGTFLLRVKGDSMVDAHIVDGDLVIVKPQQYAENGDLVVALLGEEATVKRLRVENGQMALMPANRMYEPILLKDADVRIIGKVIGVLRKY